MRLIEKIKELNPLCRAVQEFKCEAAKTRDMIAQHGAEAIHKTLIKEKPVVHPKH